MILINIVVFCVGAFLFQNVVGKPLDFHILAPPFICPKDNDTVIDKPDKTVIVLETDPDIRVSFKWIVRWALLVAPTQRLTLSVWHAAHEVERKLNVAPMENYIFFIDNADLLPGVKYIFNVTIMNNRDEELGPPKAFEIDNIKGDSKLLIEGKSDLFSVALVGVEQTYADIDFILEARVTTCFKTHDYYYVWTVTSADHNISVTDVPGSRLVIQANTLKPGNSYDVLCQVYEYSNGELFTQNGVSFLVLHRNLSINLNFYQLAVSAATPFKLHSDLRKLDTFTEPMKITWASRFESESEYTIHKINDSDTLCFPFGLLKVGEYETTLTVDLLRKSAIDIAIIQVTTEDAKLPVINMVQRSPIVNEGNVETFKANILNLVPGCSVTWYFRSQHCLVSDFSSSYDICADNVHGTRMSKPINFYSLEENFLSELTDYTNETGWKSVSLSMAARAGRVRVVVDCHCLNEDNCTSEGEVFANDIYSLNERPNAKYVSVMPFIDGKAMETVFHISTRAVVDPNKPLRYSFYAELSENDTLLLGSNLEHTTVETFLPYIGGGIYLWVDVCDSLGACSGGKRLKSKILVEPGDARTLEVLLDDVRAHVRRCEFILLRRLAMSAVVTYTNADQPEALSNFTTGLLNFLGGIENRCIENNYDQYNEFISWLQRAGIDTTKLV